MKQTEAETEIASQLQLQLPSIPNNSISQLDNSQSSSQYCLTTPNKSTRNIKHKQNLSTHHVIHSQHNALSPSSNDINALVSKYNIPSPDNIIDEIDKLLIDKLTIEHNCLEKQYMKSIGRYYDCLNKAINAEKIQKEYEDKANDLLKERKVLLKKNNKLKETIGDLSVALSAAQGEVNRLKGIIEKDKAYSKELNLLFDSKFAIEQKKQKPYSIEINYLNIEKENVLLSIEQIKGSNKKKKKEMNKRRMMVQAKVKKPKYLSNQLTAKELSDMAADLTWELDELKERLLQYENDKHNMNEKLKEQQKKLDKQSESIGNLNLIYQEKEKIAKWEKLVLNKKRSYLNTLTNQNNYILKTKSDAPTTIKSQLVSNRILITN